MKVQSSEGWVKIGARFQSLGSYLSVEDRTLRKSGIIERIDSNEKRSVTRDRWLDDSIRGS